MKKSIAISAVLALAVLLASCTGAGGAADGFTPEFRAFLAIRKALPEITRTEDLDGCAYTLDNGVLRAKDSEGNVLWQSQGDWYVEDFRLGDVDGDGSGDLLFTLWKSYSFGAHHPARMENDDASVRCHLFLYTLRAGRMKPLWGSSNLPRPIYEFELSFDGEKSPVASGALLRTQEGAYTDDFSRTEIQKYTYAWEGWGFIERE